MSGYMIEVTQEALDRANEEIVRLRAALEAAERQIGHKAEEMTPVYVVITGEVYERQETYTLYDVPPPLCDFEILYRPHRLLDTGAQAQIEARSNNKEPS